MLELVNVSSFYGNTPILTDITFRIDEGELLAVLGRNGVGKTTLARTIMGLTTRMTGTMKIDEVEFDHNGDLSTRPGGDWLRATGPWNFAEAIRAREHHSWCICAPRWQTRGT